MEIRSCFNLCLPFSYYVERFLVEKNYSSFLNAKPPSHTFAKHHHLYQKPIYCGKWISLLYMHCHPTVTLEQSPPIKTKIPEEHHRTHKKRKGLETRNWVKVFWMWKQSQKDKQACTIHFLVGVVSCSPKEGNTVKSFPFFSSIQLFNFVPLHNHHHQHCHRHQSNEKRRSLVGVASSSV